MTLLQQLQNQNGGIIKTNSVNITQLEAAGYSLHLIDRAPVFNKETLLHAIYQAGAFPAYFGFNWDALEDCLTDCSWMTKSLGIVFILSNIALLETREANTLATFLEIIEVVSKKRHAQKLEPLYFIIAE